MGDQDKSGQRIGGHFVLIVVILVLFVGWRAGLAGAGETDGEEETVVAPIPQSVSTGPTQINDTGTITQTIDYTEGELPVINDSSLAPAPNPFTYQGKLPEHSYETYIVQRGDTPNGIAEKFGIMTETLLGGNPRLSQESSLLQADVELIILPIDGVLHDVEPGDTLENISEKYAISTDDIIAYTPNNLEFPYRLYPETQVMVPGAVREVFVWTPPDLSSVAGSTSSQGANVQPVIRGTGIFIYPVGNRNFTQYYWYGHRAIDVGLPVGNTVVASDTGTVTYAGWDVWGYGNLIVVNHGNGYETFYAHLSGVNVYPGQIIYQGSVIGSSGNTGNSSGPHIHFEIRLNGNPDNPCYYLGC